MMASAPDAGPINGKYLERLAQGFGGRDGKHPLRRLSISFHLDRSHWDHLDMLRIPLEVEYAEQPKEDRGLPKRLTQL